MFKKTIILAQDSWSLSYRYIRQPRRSVRLGSTLGTGLPGLRTVLFHRPVHALRRRSLQVWRFQDFDFGPKLPQPPMEATGLQHDGSDLKPADVDIPDSLILG